MGRHRRLEGSAPPREAGLIPVLRGGAPAALALRAGGRGLLVSVHRRAVNLRLDGGPLIGILPPGRPLHPWAVVADLDPRLLSEGWRFECDGRRVLLGPFELDLAHTEVCELTLDEAQSRAADARVQRDGADADLGAPDARTALPMDAASVYLRAAADGGDGPAEAADPVIRDALAGLVERGDVQVLAGLVGLGEGLTPSGDDVLVGLLAGLDHRRFSGDAAAHRLREALIAALPPEPATQTPLLSAQLLVAAREGRYPEPVLDVLAALDGQGSAGLERTAAALAGLGHRSGRATLLGLGAALCAARARRADGAVGIA